MKTRILVAIAYTASASLIVSAIGLGLDIQKLAKAGGAVAGVGMGLLYVGARLP